MHRARLGDRLVHRVSTMAIDIGDHVPAVGLETLGRVVGKPSLDLSINRNTVVVIEHNQLAEAERTRQRTGLV